MAKKKDKSNGAQIRIFRYISFSCALVIFSIVFLISVNQANTIIQIFERNFGQWIVNYFIIGSVIPILLLIYVPLSEYFVSKLRNSEKSENIFKEFLENPNMLIRSFLVSFAIVCTLILIF